MNEIVSLVMTRKVLEFLLLTVILSIGGVLCGAIQGAAAFVFPEPGLIGFGRDGGMVMGPVVAVPLGLVIYYLIGGHNLRSICIIMLATALACSAVALIGGWLSMLLVPYVGIGLGLYGSWETRPWLHGKITPPRRGVFSGDESSSRESVRDESQGKQ
jgi:O-antigen ligase